MVEIRTIHTLLVANRGEIARRIFRTAHAMGIRTVAIYSDADADMPFVRDADLAFRIASGVAHSDAISAGMWFASDGRSIANRQIQPCCVRLKSRWSTSRFASRQIASMICDA